MTKHSPMWGGRFTAPPAETMKRLNDSFAFDFALLGEDIEGSIAWANALADAAVLNGDEAASIVNAFTEIAGEYLDDRGQPIASRLPFGDFEDVHSFVEAKLREKIGTDAGKLHTGRSRNDQVATDFRLYLRRSCDEALLLALDVASTLASRAGDEAATAMPGYTHLRQAEAITFGHWCLAYSEMIERDLSRFKEARDRADECPLGSGALAGTPLPIDRRKLALSLGFARATRNSLDAVSDRDAAADYLYSATMLVNHLSRLSEDLIFFSSDEVRYLELPDAFATGSSRMPQKKNPDVLELTRGYAARLIGDVTGLLSLLKGLPLAYNKDLQLDKEPVFRTRSALAAVLPAIGGLLQGLIPDRARMAAAAASDLLGATQVADAMARRGLPFRVAHEIVSARIAEAIATGKSLTELGPSDDITVEDLASLDVTSALDRKSALGGTAPAAVQQAARAATERLAVLRRSFHSDAEDIFPAAKTIR
ncbi:MAG: argininosuccinate lyase [Acidobacteriota bacterium]